MQKYSRFGRPDMPWEDREKKKQLEFIVNAFELDKRLRQVNEAKLENTETFN